MKVRTRKFEGKDRVLNLAFLGIRDFPGAPSPACGQEMGTHLKSMSSFFLVPDNVSGVVGIPRRT